MGRLFGQPMAWWRRCGGHANPDPGARGLANMFFCNYVHAMNIFLLTEFIYVNCDSKIKNFFLKIMLTDSNLVVTNIYSSVQWYLLQNLIQPSRKNSSILHFCCMRLSDLVSKFKIAANQCCVIVTYILSFNKEHLARFSLRPRQ